LKLKIKQHDDLHQWQGVRNLPTLKNVSYMVVCGADIKNTDPSTSGFSLQGNFIVVIDHSEKSIQPSPGSNDSVN